MKKITNQESKTKSKIGIYCRVGTVEQLDYKDYGLAGRYYLFIQKYEEYLKKYNSNPVKENVNINPKYIEMFSYMQEYFEKDYMPWRSLPKGKELEEIKRIFSMDANEILKYSRIGDMLHDDFYTLAEDELKKYYSKAKIEKTEDKLFDEINDFKFDRKFKRKVFSKETIELYRLYKEFEPIEKELYVEFNKLRANENTKKIDCNMDEMERE